MLPQNRRGFLKLSLASLGAIYFPLLDPFARATATANADPHFFFQFLVPGGLDCTYFFDARPLDMKARGLMQNYLNAEPGKWSDTNFATSLTDPLKIYRNYFSVINGVMMSPGFDGHDQNANLLLAGNPFGGESFIPHLNTAGKQSPVAIDALQAGNIASSLTNVGKSIPLETSAMVQLKQHLTEKQDGPLKAKVDSFLNSRYQKVSTGAGRFSETAHEMQVSFQGVPGLAQNLVNIQVDTNEQDPEIAFFKMAFEFFKQGVARSAIFATSIFSAIDVHAASDCKAAPESYAKIIDKLSNLMKTMSVTPYDDKRSFMDVTTFMVASEFSRTLKQMNLPVDESGTDHNTLNNSILIGGKGIRGNQVIGSSDYRSADEKLSGAHKQMDSNSIKLMGRPFDFAKQSSRTDLPDIFKAEDYLAVGSVVNTIYSQFGVSKDKYRLLGRNEDVCPVLNSLLK